MGIIKGSLGGVFKHQGRVEHKWVLWTSPKNSFMGVQACLGCGIAKGYESRKKSCVSKKPDQHMMLKRGWVLSVDAVA